MHKESSYSTQKHSAGSEHRLVHFEGHTPERGNTEKNPEQKEEQKQNPAHEVDAHIQKADSAVKKEWDRYHFVSSIAKPSKDADGYETKVVIHGTFNKIPETEAPKQKKPLTKEEERIADEKADKFVKDYYEKYGKTTTWGEWFHKMMDPSDYRGKKLMEEVNRTIPNTPTVQPTAPAPRETSQQTESQRKNILSK